ncbi:MAG: hypothetical protein V3U43_07710 [Pseudomonadales bacterium]
MSDLTAKIIGIHEAFEHASLPHAFGGALALAWCTQRARGTIDIDVNVFVSADQAEAIARSLPAGVQMSKDDKAALRREGQVRLWWDGTPLDLFLNTTDFHEEVSARIRWEQFAEHPIPFLSCNDLAVFKAFFNRTRDWADLEEMHAAGTLDINRVTAVLVKYLGVEDERIVHLARLAG